MTTRIKFAGLKRIAAEEPGAVDAAIDTLKAKLTEQLENLETMQAHLRGGAPAPAEGGPVGELGDDPDAGLHGEGIAVPEPAADENGTPLGEAKPIMAGLKRIAADAPEAIEEALGEFYLAMDEVLALTENLADHLDIDLPVGENPMGEPEGDDTPEPPAEGEEKEEGGAPFEPKDDKDDKQEEGDEKEKKEEFAEETEE